MPSKNHVGAVGEMFAAHWFLAMGLEVFLNIPASGPADLVVWNKESQRLLPVDIKSFRNPYTRSDGSYSFGFKCCLREDNVWQCLHVHGEATVRVPEGFWEALGCPSLCERA